MRDNTVDVDGLGSVLGHSLFDFDTYGNVKYGSPIEGVKPTEGGKLEKSFLNFTLNYPEWAKGDERTTRFLASVQHRASAPRGGETHSPDLDLRRCANASRNGNFHHQRNGQYQGLPIERLGRLDQSAAFAPVKPT